MNIHLKTILAMVTAFSVAMVPQSHAFAFGEAQVDEEYSVSLADSQTDTSYTKWLSSWNQTNYDSVTNVVLTPGSNPGISEFFLVCQNRYHPGGGSQHQTGFFRRQVFFRYFHSYFPQYRYQHLFRRTACICSGCPCTGKNLLLPGHQ